MMYDWGIRIREDEAMKNRISNAFDEMCKNFGLISMVWFISWMIFPNALSSWERPELMWFGSLLLAVGFFKGYRDQVKKDRATEVDK